MADVFENNLQKSRYELSVDGHIAFANYRTHDGVIYIDYVEAPPALRGTGAAGRLMSAVMTDIRSSKIEKVVPICGYAVSWLRRHDEYADLLK